jgi:hypothetical protein
VTGTLRFFDFFLKDEAHFTPPMFDPSQFFGSFYPQHSLNSETFWRPLGSSTATSSQRSLASLNNL